MYISLPFSRRLTWPLPRHERKHMYWSMSTWTKLIPKFWKGFVEHSWPSGSNNWHNPLSTAPVYMYTITVSKFKYDVNFYPSVSIITAYERSTVQRSPDVDCSLFYRDVSGNQTSIIMSCKFLRSPPPNSVSVSYEEIDKRCWCSSADSGIEGEESYDYYFSTFEKSRKLFCLLIPSILKQYTVVLWKKSMIILQLFSLGCISGGITVVKNEQKYLIHPISY